jgi:hypothetical protein
MAGRVKVLDPIAMLDGAMVRVAFARSCIGGQRGAYDKELARESYASSINEELRPAISVAIEHALEELEPREVERLGVVVLKVLHDAWERDLTKATKKP